MPEVPAFWPLFGFTIERADEDEAVLRMDVPAALRGPLGQLHGGVVAVLFDTALAVAVARRVGAEDRIATHNLNVTYVTFARADTLRCRARVLRLGKSVAVTEGEALTDGGTLVAKAMATFGIHPRKG